MAWIKATERLPKENGNYRIKNNAPSCNNGEGECEYNIETGWIVPELIKNFFKVLYWWE